MVENSKKFPEKAGNRPANMNHHRARKFHGGNGGGARRPSGKKGLFSFFYGFTGSISRELYTGAYVALSVLLFIIIGVQGIYASKYMSAAEPSQIATAGLYTLVIVGLVLLVSLVSFGYRRAHALGISGFYSIMGSSLFAPFFMFYRSERDNANDGAYSYAFTKFKKLGSFLGKTNLHKVVFLILLFGIGMATQVPDAKDAADGMFSDYQKLTLCLLAFNILQVFVAGVPFVRRYYANTVKVASFVAYNTVVILITASVVATAMMRFFMDMMGQ
ncbi:MAG: hypothetical protein LBL52_04410 [Rickettsiales bacterium]|jgi:uncharacterized membrane protein YhaH (DUF805 family)|nr:hypothetical protein [Rickettsiales bacterium]